LSFSFYIAKRYLFAKKSHNIINIISAISLGGITVGTMALIIVLSVFNGFENLVVSLFNSFNPDIKISVAEGKIFHFSEFPYNNVKQIYGVENITGTVEENALVKYRNKQHIVTIKGVSDNFDKTSQVSKMMIDGDYELERGNLNFAVVGQGVAYNLNLSLNDFENPLTIYAPKRSKGKKLNVEEAFNNYVIMPSGIFSIQQEFDSRYLIVPLRFARELFNYTDELTFAEIKLSKDADVQAVQKEIKKIVGDKYIVKNRFEQEELLYKIMKSEKLAAFMILTFILLIAIFNVIGSLSMLIIDKKKDIAVLKSLGAEDMLIRKIFLTEGVLITLAGAVSGLALGALVCWLQLTFGFVRIPNAGSMVIDSYPVKMMILDFVFVFLIVFVIGFIASWYPVKYISRKYLQDKL
jgi:lipoprotein-releasing system permease protein